MPLSYRAQKRVSSFDFGISYRPYETKLSMRDARNVFTNQGKLETRNGYSRYNSTAMAAGVQSISFFENPASGPKIKFVLTCLKFSEQTNLSSAS